MQKNSWCEKNIILRDQWIGIGLDAWMLQVRDDSNFIEMKHPTTPDYNP